MGNVIQMDGKGRTQLSPSQLMAAEADRRLNETLERFRCYNNGTEEDILDMIDDWQAEKDELANMNGEG